MKKPTKMKKVLLKMSCLMVVGVSLMACQKENSSESVSYNSPETKKNLATIQDKSSGQESKLIFGSLTNEEKANAWRCHLGECKNTLSLNADQAAFVDELIAFVTPEMYENAEKTTSDVKKLEKRSESLFSEEIRFILFADLRINPGDFTPGIQGGGNEGGVECQCSIKDDWCGKFNFTTVWQCRPIICKKGFGCGSFWRLKCGGICVLVNN